MAGANRWLHAGAPTPPCKADQAEAGGHQAGDARADDRPRYRGWDDEKAVGAVARVADPGKECQLIADMNVGPEFDVESGQREVRKTGAVVNVRQRRRCGECT